MYHTIATGIVWHGEIRNRAKDGSIYWVDHHGRPVSWGKMGNPGSTFAIRADITGAPSAPRKL